MLAFRRRRSELADKRTDVLLATTRCTQAARVSLLAASLTLSACAGRQSTDSLRSAADAQVFNFGDLGATTVVYDLGLPRYDFASTRNDFGLRLDTGLHQADAGIGAPDTTGVGGNAGCRNWGVRLPNAARDIAQADDGALYVAGFSPNEAVLTRLDACGSVRQTQTYLQSAASAAAALSLSLADDRAYLGGWMVPHSGGDPRQGMLLIVDPDDLRQISTLELSGGKDSDEIWDTVLVGDTIWSQGTSAYDQAGRRPWLVRVDTTAAQACGSPLFSATALGRGLSATAGMLYLTGGSDGQVYIAQRSLNGCAFSSPCPCPAESRYTIKVPGHSAEGRDILRVGGFLYVAGFSIPRQGGSARAMVWRVKLDDGTLQQSWSWDPSDEFDAFFGLGADNEALYAFGIRGLSESSAGEAVAAKLSLEDLSPLQHWGLGDPGAYFRGIVSDGRWIAAGGTKTVGHVRACPTNGPCQ